MFAVKSTMAVINHAKPIFESGILQCLLWSNIKLSKHYSVWEPDRHDDYSPEEEQPASKLAKEGMKDLKKQLIKFTKEQKDKIGLPMHNIKFSLPHNDYEVIYNFNNQDIINEWKVITDKAFKQGKSEAEFVLGPQKHGVFRGVVNTETTKDGVVKYAGYAGIRSPFNMKSFHRHAPLDWSQYSHLLVRCRGDGRPYQLSIGMHRTFDIVWHDQYNFPLYTRGGPYWQLAKIPFRKFYLSSKGRIQDKQEMLWPEQVLFLTITQCDGYSGPFHLEVDFIGVINDATHKRVHEYELYDHSNL